MDFLQLIGPSSYNSVFIVKNGNQFQTKKSIASVSNDGGNQQSENSGQSRKEMNQQDAIGRLFINQFLQAFKEAEQQQKNISKANPYLLRIHTKMKTLINQKVRQQLGFFLFLFEESGIFEYQRKKPGAEMKRLVKSNLKIRKSKQNASLLRQIYKTVYSTLDNSSQQIIQLINWKTIKLCETIFCICFADYLRQKGLCIQNISSESKQPNENSTKVKQWATRINQKQSDKFKFQVNDQLKNIHTGSLFGKSQNDFNTVVGRKTSIQIKVKNNKRIPYLNEFLLKKRKKEQLFSNDKFNFKQIQNLKLNPIRANDQANSTSYSCNLISNFLNQKSFNCEKSTQIVELQKKIQQRQRSTSQKFIQVKNKLQQAWIANQYEEIQRIKTQKQFKDYQRMYANNHKRLQSNYMLINRAKSVFFPHAIKQKIEQEKQRYKSIAQKVLKIKENQENNDHFELKQAKCQHEQMKKMSNSKYSTSGSFRAKKQSYSLLFRKDKRQNNTSSSLFKISRINDKEKQRVSSKIQKNKLRLKL